MNETNESKEFEYPPVEEYDFNLIGADFWNRYLFRVTHPEHLKDDGIVLVDVDGVLHTLSGEGEPAFPTRFKTPDPIVRNMRHYQCNICYESTSALLGSHRERDGSCIECWTK